ncbi:MAG: hypothetical protein LUD47_07040 [Clostridia bacterium]|nr:hypothetical protein [Clostridia bacterium]
MAGSKVDTLIGFAIKAGKIKFGGELVSREYRDVYIILVSADAAKNTMKVATNAGRRFSCPIVVCDDLAGAVHKKDCKICAIKDSNLAKGIVENLTEGYRLYTGGANA